MILEFQAQVCDPKDTSLDLLFFLLRKFVVKDWSDFILHLMKFVKDWGPIPVVLKVYFCSSHLGLKILEIDFQLVDAYLLPCNLKNHFTLQQLVFD